MGERIEDILKKPQFDSLPAERKAQLIDLSGRLAGKGSMESMSIIGDFVKRMPKGGELTRQEQEAMAEAFLESLPEADRTRFRNILKMLTKF